MSVRSSLDMLDMSRSVKIFISYLLLFSPSEKIPSKELEAGPVLPSYPEVY
jgi:hypothetical protein